MTNCQNEISKLPPKYLPLLYLFFADLCLALALVTIVFYPQDFTGFYYHPHILAITHLITLGWITTSITGSLYIVGPMALQVWMPTGWKDVIVYILFIAGVSGMVTHFWIQQYSGLIYSAASVYTGMILFSVTFLSRLQKARAPRFVLFHIGMAFVNFWIAATWGILIGINKLHGFLPTPVASNIYAHAHLATIGWGMMMAFGVAYRLIPMFLPGKPVSGKTPWISGILVQLGVFGLFVTLLFVPSYSLFFGTLSCSGIFLFLGNVAYTIFHPKPAPPPVPPKPDFSILQVEFAFFWLVVSAILGLTLSQLPATETTLRLALGYGASAFIGFFGQIILGFKPKILSVFTWYHLFETTKETEGLPRPVDMPVRIFSGFTGGLWFFGMPLLFFGIILGRRMLIVSGACLLLAGLVIAIINEAVILKRL